MESNFTRVMMPGDRVVHRSSGECGILIHSWMSEETGDFDCYVAFFGDDFPTEMPSAIPYVLRYASTSLRHAT